MYNRLMLLTIALHHLMYQTKKSRVSTVIDVSMLHFSTATMFHNHWVPGATSKTEDSIVGRRVIVARRKKQLIQTKTEPYANMPVVLRFQTLPRNALLFPHGTHEFYYLIFY